ncbi:MAG TPA: carbon-phosphorus lyase complex subunit PhnI [Chthonomonadaceae bacterium]|nr:carbon-phosphorus lyase complex subunit PhnI [Chthonomonadaceae bacterium]
MAYVAIKGGRGAIHEAKNQLEVLRTRGAENGEPPLRLDVIENQLHFLHSEVLSEGGLYDPELASLALKQSLGDTLEAAFFLRAFRSTRPRIGILPELNTSKMRLIRRISAAFKEIPGGQMLGPTPDYTQRLFNFSLMEETPEAFRNALADWMEGLETDAELDTFPKVVDFLRAQGLVEDCAPSEEPPYDITREPFVFPMPRSAALSILSRGQRGSLLALAYSSMRGYGSVHPTVGELRVGYLPIEAPHPVTGVPIEIGEVLMTECEIITGAGPGADRKTPKLGLGYAACFGHNEVKAISMAVLDRALVNGRRGGKLAPAEDPEFVLMHVDGLDSMGFCIHYKLPHYVTFQAGLEQLRAKQSLAKEAEAQAAEAVVGKREVKV